MDETEVDGRQALPEAPLMAAISQDQSPWAVRAMSRGEPSAGSALLGEEYEVFQGPRAARNSIGSTSARFARSLRCLNFLAFIASAGFSILLPSLWPRLEEAGLSKQFYGFVVSSYCVGQMAGSVVIGSLVSKVGFKKALLLSLFVEFAGYIGYTVTSNGYIILASRLVAGFGSGNLAAGESFVAVSTTPEARAGALGTFAGFQALGFVVGPGIASVLALIPVAVGQYPLRFDLYTSPSYFGALAAFLNALVIVLYFVEPPQHDLSKAQAMRELGADEEAPAAALSDDEPLARESGIPHLGGLILAAGMYFTDMLVFSLGETALVPLTRTLYGWQVVDNGIFLGCLAVTATAVFLLMPKLSEWLGSELRLYSVGTVIIAVGLCLATSWPTMIALLSESPLPTVQNRGLPWPLLGVGMLIALGVGHPFGMVGAMSMYSNLVDSSRQAALMGWLEAAGSAGRIVGPLYGSQLLGLVDTNIAVGAGIMSTCTAVLLLAAVVTAKLARRHLTGAK